MAIENRQLAIGNPDEWVSVAEASVTLGESPRTLCYRCRNQWAPRNLARLQPQASGLKSIWFISRRVDRRLSLASPAPTRDVRARESLIKNHPDHRVRRAYRKAFWLQEWRTRCTRPRLAGQTDVTIAREIVAEASATEGQAFPISVRTLQLWWQRWKAFDPDGRVLGIAALVDAYRGPMEASTVVQDPSGSTIDHRQSPIGSRSPEAIEYFYAVYHSQAEHSIKTCHDATVAESRRRDWRWPKGCRSTARWLQRNDELAKSCLYRRGRDEFSNRFMQHLEIDYTAIAPGERFVTDSTQVDFWVAYKTRQIRPVLCAVLDCRSRCIVGWHLGPTSNQDSIIAAFRMAFRDWAVPERVHMDHGKDFCSALLRGSTKRERREFRRQYGADWEVSLAAKIDTYWRGVFGELGVDVSEALVKHPWAKGQIERWFGTFEDQCGKTFVTYCGNSPVNRPECTEVLRAGPGVPTMDEARARIASYLELYNRTAHGGSGMDGLSPLAVWNTAGSLRKALDSELLALMHTRGVYRVGANGVGFRIGGTGMTYGASSAVLRRYAGRDVLITLDPEHCECCYAFTADPGKHIFVARLEANQRIPINTDVDSLREAIRSLRSRNKDFTRSAAEAPRRLRTAGQEVAALRNEQVSELRATGTDDLSARPAIRPVRTGFEGASIAARIVPPAQDIPQAEEIPDADFFGPDEEPVQKDVDDDADFMSSPGSTDSHDELEDDANFLPARATENEESGDSDDLAEFL